MSVLSKPKPGVWEIEIVERKGSIGRPLYRIATIEESLETTGRKNWEAVIPEDYFEFKPEVGRRYEVLIERSSSKREGYTIKEFP